MAVPGCFKGISHPKTEDTMARWLSPWGVGDAPTERHRIDPFVQLHREMNRLFDDMFRGAGVSGASADVTAPFVDVSETDKEIKVCAELPGVDEKDVEVTLDDDVLTIRGEKKVESEEKRENYHFQERARGSFARSIRLPRWVNAKDASASFQNGILTVMLPKPAEQQQRTRRIEIAKSQGRQAPGNVNIARERSAAGSKPGSESDAPSVPSND
jgi:HSP20 family protein